MPMYINGALAGMGDAVKDKEYQAKLSEKTTQILGDRTSISVDELKKNSLFKKAYKQLNAEGKKKFDAILSMDGDAQNVSEKELKTLMTLLDADLSKDTFTDRELFLMDGEFSTGKKGGIYQATDKEIQYVYQNTKTRAEIQAEEIAKTKAKAAKLEEINGLVAEYDIKNGSELTKGLNTISSHVSAGNSAGLEVFDAAVSNFLNGQIQSVDTYRDGGSRLYTLKDGTKIYHDHKFMGSEVGFVTITHPDGSIEKYNAEGELVGKYASEDEMFE